MRRQCVRNWGIAGSVSPFSCKGNPKNYVYYKLATEQFQHLGAAACNASRTDGGLPAGACIFRDITQGDMDIPCGQKNKGKDYDCFGANSAELGELSSSDVANKPAYRAGVGYDLATGLGSVNATNLFDAWLH